MSISASQVQTSDTLEKFRQEFNKLRTDVNGLDSGTITVTTVSVQSSDFGNDGFIVSLAGEDLTGNKTITFPDVNGTILTNANANLGTVTTSASDVDHVLVNDGGVLKRISASNLGVSGNPAADDIQAGDGNVNITTSSGQINIGPAQSDQDVNIKGTDSDGNTNFVAVNVDMSSNGLATFSDSIKIKNGGNIGNAGHADVITLGSDAVVSFKDDIKIKDGGTIGSASDADSITIASGGGVTLSQAPTFTLGSDATADIFYRSSGGPIARLGIGSAGQVLQVNSGANAPEWADNGLVLIGTVVANNTAQLDITGLVASNFDSFQIVFAAMHPVNDDTAPILQLGDSNGIDEGASDYSYGSQGSGFVDHSHSSIIMTNDISSTNRVGNATGQGWSGTATLHLNNTSSHPYPMVHGTMAYRSSALGSGSQFFSGTFAGSRNASITVDRIRFKFQAFLPGQTGNVETGRMTVYGIKSH